MVLEDGEDHSMKLDDERKENGYIGCIDDGMLWYAEVLALILQLRSR